MTLYKIYIGTYFSRDIRSLLFARNLDSFSVVSHAGYWKGQAEISISIEILDPDGSLESQIYAVAEDIRSLSGQDCIFIAEIPVRTLKSCASGLTR